LCSPEHFRVRTPQKLQKVLDELEASRSSRKRAWENLQELRWVLQDSAGMKLPSPAKKTIDLEGRLIKDGVRKAIRDRQDALHELINAIKQYRKLSESKPLTLQGSDYAHAVLELNKRLTTQKDCCCSDLRRAHAVRTTRNSTASVDF
jgi:hypothetical protein